MTPPAPSTRQRLGARGLFLAAGCASGALVAALSPWLVSLAALPDALRWLLGLAVHWQWVYLVGGVLGTVAALQARRYTALAALAVIVGSWGLQLPAAPAADATSAGRTLAIATANLNVDNRDPQRLLAWALSADGPEVLVLHEFTEDFAAALAVAGGQAWRDAFPHSVLQPMPTPFGIAVMSRWPIVTKQAVGPENDRATPKLRVMIDWAGQPVAVTAVHPMPPIAPRFVAERDRSLLAEARWLAGSGAPGVLAGDLNDTPWSSGMRPLAPHLLRASGLAPTWPNAWGWLSLLPLDHVLVTASWTRVGGGVGPDIGSDHRPVVTVLRRQP